MKTEEQIKKEIERHKAWLKENQFSRKNDLDTWLHKSIVDALEWVLKD